MEGSNYSVEIVKIYSQKYLFVSDIEELLKDWTARMATLPGKLDFVIYYLGKFNSTQKCCTISE